MPKKVIFFILLLLITVSNLSASYVAEQKWGAGATFLGFLGKHKIHQNLYFEMDMEDQEVVTEIRAGTRYYSQFSNEGELLQVLIPISEELQIRLKKSKKEYGYSFDTIPIAYKKEVKSVTIEIKKSPYQDLLDATDNYYLANEFIKAFKHNINFRSDIKIGDKLVVLYTQKKRLGKIFGQVNIKTAMVQTRGKNNYIVRYKERYYDESGKIIISTSGFQRPCRFRRISSRFTHKRWHPILRRYRAHLGVDYAAPTGTHVKAAAKGRVSFVGWKGGYGRVVEVVHANGYKTLYAHLSRFRKGIRGKRVKKGQLIAFVGSSGRSTGPHLHFGLYKNGRAMNPEKRVVIVKTTKPVKNNPDFKELMASSKKMIKDLIEIKLAHNIIKTNTAVN